jgi:hypothetical protein
MRPLCLLLVLTACGGAAVTAKVSTDTPEGAQLTAAAPVEAAPAPRQEVTFGSKPLAAGSTFTYRGTRGTNAVAVLDRGGIWATGDLLVGEDVERKYEVLETSGAMVSRAKVTAVRLDRERYGSGRLQRPRSAIVGKTYVVARREDDVLVITTDKGAKVSDKEGNEISDEFGAFFRVPHVSFPAGTMKVGEVSEQMTNVLRAAMVAGAPGAVGFHELSAALTGTRDCGGTTCGVFHVRLDVSMMMNEVDVRSRLDGDLLVSTADGFPREMAATGVVYVTGARGAAEGTARMRATWSSP